MVTSLERVIDKCISGLPMQIQNSALSYDPKIVHDAITLVGTLTENHVKVGTLTCKSTKKPTEKAMTEPSSEAIVETSPKPIYNNKGKHQNHALISQIAHQSMIPKVNPTIIHIREPSVL